MARQSFALILWLVSWTAAAAPRADLWERWSAHDDRNGASVDHRAWDEFLGKYVVRDGDGINRVRYGAVSPADRNALRDYLQRMQATPVTTYSRAEQRAFWINLYNAETVNVVLDHYPVKSIRDIDLSPGWFSDGPWGAKLLKVEGEPVSLDDIEHRILRPIWKDPRTHYAVNCASLGCPNLAPHAYTAAFTEALLDEGARAFVNHPRAARIREGLLEVSSIYKWFASDFGGETGVLAHLRQYAGRELADELGAHRTIDAYRYDWSLNDAH